jgi:hypothetical protein
MNSVPISQCVGGRAKCDACGTPSLVSPGRNLPSAVGNTQRPPTVRAGFPPWAFQYQYPPTGPVWLRMTCILACPRCGNRSHPDWWPVEPVPEPEETTP